MFNLLLRHIIKWKIITFVICFFLLLNKNLAQTIPFSRLTYKDGLESNFVTCFTQDMQGVMWIGTNMGLYRYDGSSFDRVELKSAAKIKNNVINCLLVDALNNLYIGTENGLNILNDKRNNDRFELKNKGRVTCIYKIKNGDIWVFSDQVYNYRNAKLTYPLKITKNNNLGFEVEAVTKTGKDAYDFNFKNNFTTKIKTVKVNGVDSLIENHYSILATSILASNGLYYAINIKGYLCEQEKEIVFLEQVSKGLGEKICCDTDGNIWIVINKNKLYRYNIISKQLEFLTPKLDNVGFINTLFTDMYGRVWIGTEKGIFIFSGKAKSFNNFEIKFSDGTIRNALSSRKIIELKNNKIAVAYNTELALLSKKADNLYAYEYVTIENGTPINTKINTQKRTIYFEKKSNISNIYDMYYDGNDNIWFSGLGLHHWNINNTYLTSHLYALGSSKKEYFFNKDHYSLAFDGTLFWQGSNQQLLNFNPKTEKYANFKDNNGNEFFTGHSIWDIIYTNNVVWIGSNLGMYSIDKNTKKVTKIKLASKNNIEINALHLDNENCLWIGSVANGVYKFNTKNKQIIQYTQKEGLSNNTISSIFSDKKGRIWIATYFGLNYFDKQKNNFVSFFEEDGLKNNELNRKAFGVLSSGDIVVGGISGYNIYNPDKVLEGIEKVFIRLNKISKINEKGDIETTKIMGTTMPEIVLKPSEKLLNLYFSLSDYFQIDLHTYYYKISGKIEDWQLIKNQSYLSIASLPAGNYIIKIKGAQRNGKFAENELEIKLKVKQVFYKTWWFISLLFLMAIAIITYFYHLRIKNVKRLASLRTKIASDLHDEVGGNLVRISMLSDKMNKESAASEKDNEFQNISSMSRGVISMMKDVIWSIDSRNDTMQDLLNRMYEHLYDMLSAKEIAFTFNHDTIKETQKIDLIFRQNVFLIFKESINNVVKHSNATLVEIEFKKEQPNFKLSIKDNGQVFLNKPMHTGQGLKNIQMRTKQLNGIFERKMDNGFQIILQIPYSK